jgi:gamma-glutamyltranspeptidase/glutathione hydrolase
MSALIESVGTKSGPANAAPIRTKTRIPRLIRSFRTSIYLQNGARRRQKTAEKRWFRILTTAPTKYRIVVKMRKPPIVSVKRNDVGEDVTVRTVGQARNSWQPARMGQLINLLAGASLALCTLAPATFAQSPQPEDSTGRGAHELVHADRHMVAAAHRDAAGAAREMLSRGGSAVDAAIAAQLVLNLVEPQSSGIGGGAFLLFHDAKHAETIAYDGRETAPRAVRPDHFLKPDGTPLSFREAVIGGQSVATPGTVAMLAMAHEEHGRLPWADLFTPAIALARDGFVVGRRLAAMLSGPRADSLRTFPEARAYFFPDGEPLKAGTRKRNPAFADTLARIAQDGPAAIYRGDIANDIAAAVRASSRQANLLTVEDLAAYQPVRRAPVCIPYRTYRVCGMGPPSSGGITVGQILGILANFDLPGLGRDNPQSWHLLNEASKLAFADRNRYIADADLVPVPTDGLLDAGYLATRAGLIRRETSLIPRVPSGTPPSAPSPKPPDNQDGRPGTSHIVIVDDDGNAVSMTSTIEAAFGSQVMVRGFLLNNEMTDFSFIPAQDGLPVANAVAPGKRPRSSMAPTLVFDTDGHLRLAVGSPGGSRIIGYVTQALVAVLDWNMDIQSAIDMGHLTNRNGVTDLEKGTDAERLKEPLEALGNRVQIRDMNSGLHGIEIIDGRLRGGADPRREGIALGD